MNTTTIKLILVSILFLGSDSSAKDTESIDLGINFVNQNYFAGALIDDIDVLQQSDETIRELFVKWHAPLDESYFYELELGFGLERPSLQRNKEGNRIRYSNKNNFYFGANIGAHLDSNNTHSIYSYLYIANRRFNIDISSNERLLIQTDGQSFVRLGVGYQYQLNKHVAIRAFSGRTYVDFGNLVTDMDVNDGYDAGVSLVYHAF